MGAEGPHGQGRAPGPGTCAPARLRFFASFACFCFCLASTVCMYSTFVFSACGGGAGPGLGGFLEQAAPPWVLPAPIGMGFIPPGLPRLPPICPITLSWGGVGDTGGTKSPTRCGDIV